MNTANVYFPTDQVIELDRLALVRIHLIHNEIIAFKYSDGTWWLTKDVVQKSALMRYVDEQQWRAFQVAFQKEWTPRKQVSP